jgi:hypothetical protein
MTNKIQYSKKFPDGTILVVGGDTVEEFVKNYTEFRKTEVAKNIFQDAVSPPTSQVATSNPPATTTTGSTNGDEVFWTTLPEDSMLEVIRTKDKTYGEISPFPGTKYKVKVWIEVLKDFADYDEDTWEMSLSGWEVAFVKNEKGYPLKVVDVK